MQKDYVIAVVKLPPNLDEWTMMVVN